MTLASLLPNERTHEACSVLDVVRDTFLRTHLLLTPPQGQGRGLDHCQAVQLVARLVHGAVAAVVAAGAGVQELHAVAAFDTLRPQRQGAGRTPERKRRQPAPCARILLAQTREKLVVIGTTLVQRESPPPVARLPARREVGGGRWDTRCEVSCARARTHSGPPIPDEQRQGDRE